MRLRPCWAASEPPPSTHPLLEALGATAILTLQLRDWGTERLRSSHKVTEEAAEEPG